MPLSQGMGISSGGIWQTYRGKYPVVGILVDPPYNPADFDIYAGPFASVANEIRSGILGSRIYFFAELPFAELP